MNNRRLNDIFRNMKRRCYGSYSKNYKNYGARGIKLCDEWNNKETVHLKGRGCCTKGYLAFKAWALANGYTDNLTIDRIDVNKDYSPENCRWVSMQIQMNNKRNNHYITYNNQTKTMKQWAEELDINYSTLDNRLNTHKMSVEKALGGKECQR